MDAGLTRPCPHENGARLPDSSAHSSTSPGQRETLLDGVLRLGEVESAESLARKVLDERLRFSGAYLNRLEYDDALSYLVGESWALWLRYDRLGTAALRAARARVVARSATRLEWTALHRYKRERRYLLSQRTSREALLGPGEWLAAVLRVNEVPIATDKIQAFSTFAYRILWRRVASWYRQRFCDTRYREKPVMVSLDDNDLDELDWEAADDSRDDGLYERINVAALTPEGRRIFEQLARPLVEKDMSLEEIAQQYGYGRRWATKELERLREEIAPMIGQAA